MPSTSSSSSCPTWEHGVFLCFRGDDTREGFTSHLFQALLGSGINTFMDDRLPKGRDISELQDRIEKSRISVVIFSENFASSRWCLDELVKILECKETMGQEVLPVFYKVPPSQLRDLSKGKTGEYLAKHRDIYGISPEKIEAWRVAVKHFADLKGWHYTQGTESRLVYEIVETIQGISDLKIKDHVTLEVDDNSGSPEPCKLYTAKHGKAAVIVILVLGFAFFAFWYFSSPSVTPSLADVDKALDSIDLEVLGSIYEKEMNLLEPIIANLTRNAPSFPSSFQDPWTSWNPKEETGKPAFCEMRTPDNETKPCDEDLLRAISRLPPAEFNGAAQETGKPVFCQMRTPDNETKPCDEDLLRAISQLPPAEFNGAAGQR